VELARDGHRIGPVDRAGEAI